jgi:hypothetical protein
LVAAQTSEKCSCSNRAIFLNEKGVDAITFCREIMTKISRRRKIACWESVKEEIEETLENVPEHTTALTLPYGMQGCCCSWPDLYLLRVVGAV